MKTWSALFVACGFWLLLACTAPARAKEPTSATVPLAQAECISDLVLDATRRDEQGEAVPGSSRPKEDLPLHEMPWDLDGDGKREHQVLRACGATGNCERLLYLTGAGCNRFGGVLSGQGMRLLPAKSHGLPGLATFWNNGCAGTEGVVIELAYDGTRYRQGATVQCRCVDQPDAGARPARCPPWE